MRVAVTGASGFLGGALARRLVEQGHEVFAYGRRHIDSIEHSILNYSQWDLRDGPITAPFVDAVVHCAAMVGDWGREADYHRVNVDGTMAVLTTFSDVDRFIHVSTTSVYSSNQPNRHLTEDAPVGTELHTAYAKTKTEAEQAVTSSGRNAVILRPHIVYGPGDTTLLPRVLSAIRFGCLLVPGNGKNYISVTHISNFVHAVCCALDGSTRSGTFNIADREPVTVDELLRTLLGNYGVEVKLLYIPRSIAWTIAVAGEAVARLAGSVRSPRLTRYLVTQIAGGHTLDLTRASRQLGYEPHHSFRDQF